MKKIITLIEQALEETKAITRGTVNTGALKSHLTVALQRAKDAAAETEAAANAAKPATPTTPSTAGVTKAAS